MPGEKREGLGEEREGRKKRRVPSSRARMRREPSSLLGALLREGAGDPQRWQYLAPGQSSPPQEGQRPPLFLPFSIFSA